MIDGLSKTTPAPVAPPRPAPILPQSGVRTKTGPSASEQESGEESAEDYADEDESDSSRVESEEEESTPPLSSAPHNPRLQLVLKTNASTDYVEEEKDAEEEDYLDSGLESEGEDESEEDNNDSGSTGNNTPHDPLTLPRMISVPAKKPPKPKAIMKPKIKEDRKAKIVKHKPIKQQKSDGTADPHHSTEKESTAQSAEESEEGEKDEGEEEEHSEESHNADEEPSETEPETDSSPVKYDKHEPTVKSDSTPLSSESHHDSTEVDEHNHAEEERVPMYKLSKEPPTKRKNRKMFRGKKAKKTRSRQRNRETSGTHGERRMKRRKLLLKTLKRVRAIRTKRRKMGPKKGRRNLDRGSRKARRKFEYH